VCLDVVGDAHVVRGGGSGCTLYATPFWYCLFAVENSDLAPEKQKQKQKKNWVVDTLERQLN
jgi:hypothetical protein